MALQQDASGSSTYASILSKVPSYFIGEEIEVQGATFSTMLSVALADQRIQTCLGVLEKLGFDFHSSVWLWAFLNHHFPICVTGIIPTLWRCFEDVKRPT